MQLAAMLNGNRDSTLREAGIKIGSDTILKNYARLLPRMCPAQMFETMSGAAQTWFMGYAGDVVQLIHDDIIRYRQQYESNYSVEIDQAVKTKKLRSKFATTDTAIEGNQKLRQLLRSIGDPQIVIDISSQALFGKMAMAGTPDDMGGGLLGVPVEIRHHTDKFSIHRKNWMTRAEWEDSIRIWYLRTSINLHGNESAKRLRGE